MVFLSDRDLLSAIGKGALKVEPFDPEKINPGSIDFSLGTVFRIFKYYPMLEIDPKNRDGLEEMTETVEVPVGQVFILKPRALVLGTTLEKIGLSPGHVGFIEGKSSYARLGVSIHVTAGFIHPGSYGLQTLEIKNLTDNPIRLYPGARICQIIVAETKTPADKPYSGKYYDQKGPLASKVTV